MFSGKQQRDINKPSGTTPLAQKPKLQSSSDVLPTAPTWPGTSAKTTENLNATPLQGGAESSGSRAPGLDSASSLMEFLKGESEKRDEQHRQLVGSMDTLRNTVVGLKNSIDVEKKTREKEIADVKTQIAGIEQRDKEIIAEMVKKEVAVFSSGGIRDEHDADRERQVIVTGFDEREEKNIVDGIKKELEKRDLQQRVTNIFTFVDPSKVGVIEFETVAGKEDSSKN